MSINEAYAKASKPQSGGYYIQQDLNKEICQTVAISQNGTVKDSRDGTIYTIGRIKDGNCWMLDNMALDLTNPTTLANVTSENTNASFLSLSYLKYGGGTASNRYAITGVSEWSTNSTYSSSGSYSDPLIATSGNCIDTTHCANNPESGKWTKDSLPPDQNGEHTYYGNGSGKIGIYYNYCAASAGSYCYGDGTSYGNPYGNATEDICPANWRMPSAITEQQKLINRYGATTPATSTDSLQYDLSTPLSGVFPTDSSAKTSNQGRIGFFWSSTFFANMNMGYLSVKPDEVNTYGYYRNDGLSLRCLVGP